MIEPSAEQPKVAGPKYSRTARRRGCDAETLAGTQVWDGWDRNLHSNWIELCDWLIDSRLVITSGKLESFLRLMPADAIFKLATSTPGTKVSVKGQGQSYTFSLSGRWASLNVRKGNDYGHLCDVETLCPEGDLQDWAQAVADTFGSIPYPNSAGIVAGGLLRWPLPAREYPPEVLRRAWNCCKASRMEALTLGTVKGYAYDYTAAFPSVARDLPEAHPARCDWVDDTDYHSGAFYGFILAEVTIPEGVRASPVSFRYADFHRADDPLHVAHPTGAMTLWLEKSELDLITEMGYSATILEASWGFPKNTLYPFRDFVDRMWEIRRTVPALSQTSKILSNAALGLMGSVHVDSDWLSFEEGTVQSAATWNPVYDATKMGQMRSKIFRLGLKAGLDNVAAFTIDGVITTQKLKPDKEQKPGALRLESEGEYFLANDFLKDRPGTSRWRDAVQATGEGLKFQASIGHRVSVQSLRAGGKFDDLGKETEDIVLLGLGAHQRSLPEGVTAQDFLGGPIRTAPIDVSDINIEARAI